MKLALVHLSAAACPYRLLDDADQEIAWANDFLDAQHLRQLSPRSLRAYAYDLLHFARWFQSQPTYSVRAGIRKSPGFSDRGISSARPSKGRIHSVRAYSNPGSAGLACALV